MSDYDNDRLLQMQRDGIRLVSGQHMDCVPEAAVRWHGGWLCSCCMDQDCDFCNDEDPRRGTDGEGDRDWKLDR